MKGYDASDALDDLFGGGGDGYAAGAGAAVSSRTEAILDGPAPADTIDAVLRLAEGLPSLDDVREVAEDDTSELSDQEQQQKEQTEEVIRTALSAGDAALWVIAQGLDRAAKGKWWRRTHRTLGAYVEDLTKRSAVYGRQLRAGAPLALETARRTGTVPNPGQVKETRRTEKLHGRDAAVTLYEVVRDVSAELGERPTAASLRAVHEQLPARLPEVPDQQRAAIEETTRTSFGLGAAIAAPTFESDSNNGAAIAAPWAPDTDTAATEDGIQDAEIVPEHLATMKDGLKALIAVERMLTRDVFAQAAANPSDPSEAAEYEDVREKIMKRATTLRNRALRAPIPK